MGIEKEIKRIKVLMEVVGRYRVYRSSVDEPSEVEIEGKPEVWCMLGPLPDEVVEYINSNVDYSVDVKTGEYLVKPDTGEKYKKHMSGKNRDWYIFDERYKNWFTDHVMYHGKAVILNYDEWRKIFGKKSL